MAVTRYTLNKTNTLSCLLLFALGACGGSTMVETDLPEEKETPAPAANPSDAPAERAPAPDFELSDLDGKTVSLSSFRGKTVVLEWFNPGCPFVNYAYTDGTLKGMADLWRRRGVVWLAINSGAPGKQGHGDEANRVAREQWSMAQPILIDESGEVGRLFGAKTTPHIFIVDPDGKLAYSGAVDNSPFGKIPSGGLVNYVVLALDALLNGQEVTTHSTQSYGCSVKYSD